MEMQKQTPQSFRTKTYSRQVRGTFFSSSEHGVICHHSQNQKINTLTSNFQSYTWDVRHCHCPKCFDSMIPPWSQAPPQKWDLLSFWSVLMASSIMQSGENPAVFDNNPSKDTIFSLTEASFSCKETPKKIPNTARLKKKKEQHMLPAYIYLFKKQQMLSQVIIT